MKFETTKTQTIDTRAGIPSPITLYHQNASEETFSQNNLSAFLQKMFKILTHEMKNSAINTENDVINPDNGQEKETSLEHLENCANAARQTEAFDQYE